MKEFTRSTRESLFTNFLRAYENRKLTLQQALDVGIKKFYLTRAIIQRLYEEFH